MLLEHHQQGLPFSDQQPQTETIFSRFAYIKWCLHKPGGAHTSPVFSLLLHLRACRLPAARLKGCSLTCCSLEKALPSGIEPYGSSVPSLAGWWSTLSVGSQACPESTLLLSLRMPTGPCFLWSYGLHSWKLFLKKRKV